MQISPNFLGKEFFFLFNNHRININEEKDLISFGLEDGIKIKVFKSQNILGGI